MNILFARLILLLLTTLSFSVLPQSLKSISSEIKEEMRPIERTLNSLDKSHLNKLSWAEKKMAVSSNKDLQKDLYQRMMKVRNLIYTYSTKAKSKQSIENLKLQVQGYHKNLTRLLAIFFNFHQKFGGFPTMKHMRSLNPYIHVDAFIQIADLVQMKARHISDEKIEVLVKEVEYIQIASSVYTSNINNNQLRSDYAHLVQFMATQQTVINRGQLSQLDQSAILDEQEVSQCMPQNLYLGESRNFAISEHALNTEDKMIQFFDKFSRNLGPIVNEVASKNPISQKLAEKLAGTMAKSGDAKLLLTEEVISKQVDNMAYEANKIIREDESITIKDLDVVAEKLGVDVGVFGVIGEGQSFVKLLSFDRSEESKQARKEAISKSFQKQIASSLLNNLGSVISSNDTAKKINIAFLNGDNVSREEFTARARRYVEMNVYKGLAAFIKYVNGTKETVSMKAYASSVTQIMNNWEAEFKASLNSKLSSFSLESVQKTKLNHFVEAEFYKALPYMKSLYLTRLMTKSGNTDARRVLQSHPQRHELKFAPDTISELKSLQGGVTYSSGDGSGILENKELLDNLYTEIAEAYSEMTPFIDIISTNPNDFFFSQDGFVRLNTSKLDEKVFANMDEYTQKRSYAVDMKYRVSLQKQFMELSLYAKTGDKNYLSPRMKRYLAARSRNGNFSKRTAKALLQESGDPQKQVYNSSKKNLSIESIIAKKDEVSTQKKSLLWNIVSWKIGEYLIQLGVNSTNIDESLNIMTPIFVNAKGQRQALEKSLARETNLAVKDNIKDQRIYLKQDSRLNTQEKSFLNNTVESKKNFTALPSTISSYASEVVTMVSFATENTPSAAIPFRRGEGIFKAAKSKIKLLSNLIVKLGMAKNFMKARVASKTDGGLYELNAFDYKRIAQTRVNELYAFSSLLRTPYKLGTSGDMSPTAFRLLKAYDVTANKKVNANEMKSIIKQTIFQAMRNSNEMAEKWCTAVYSRSGSNNEFNHLFRNSPLMRRELIAEIDRVEQRRSRTFSLEDLKATDEYLAEKAKSTGEQIHETMEAVSMALGIIMLVALALTGIGAIGSAAILGIGTGAFAVTMNQVIFLFFAISFGSRMHHIYFRVPATLNAQYKVASTQVIKTLYTDWDELESKIQENTNERTSPSKIAWHIGEGLMQGAFAYHALKVPFVRYSGKHLATILNKAGMPVHSVLKPMKSVKLYTKFKWSSVKGNWKSFRNGLENVANKLLKRRDYILGANAQHKAQLLDKALRVRVANSLGKGFDRSSLVKLRDALKREAELLKLDKGLKGFNPSAQAGATRAFKALEDIDPNLAQKAYEVLGGRDISKLAEIAPRNLFERIRKSASNLFQYTKNGYAHRRAYFKALREGNLSKYKALRNKIGNNVDEFQEALEQMALKLRAEKLAAKQSMLKKVEDALNFKNPEMLGEAKVFDELAVLFGEGKGAFNQGEAMMFATEVMTSLKVGGLPTKYKLLKSMMDHGVLSQRIKSAFEVYMQQKPGSVSTFVKGAEQFVKLNRGSRIFNIPRNGKQVLDWLETQALSPKGSKRAAIFISLTVGTAMMWKEINFYYQTIKESYSSETGEEFQGPDFIESIDDLNAIIDGDKLNVPNAESHLEKEIRDFEVLARPAIEAYEDMVEKSKLLEEEINNEEGSAKADKIIKLAKSSACQEKEFQNCTPDSSFVRSQSEQLELLKSEAKSLELESVVKQADEVAKSFSKAN